MTVQIIAAHILIGQTADQEVSKLRRFVNDGMHGCFKKLWKNQNVDGNVILAGW